MSADLENQGPARPAFRFRFSLLTLFVVLTLVCLLLAWIVQPNRAVATALFQISISDQGLGGDRAAYDDQEFEIFCKTQVALIKSHYVLQAAVRDPQVASLPLFMGSRDPVAWLQERLEIEFPQDSEILAIQLRGTESQANDLRAVVDAVAKAYFDEVVYNERAKQLANRDALSRSLTKLNEELEEQMGDYYNIARELGVGVADGENVLQQLTVTRLERVEEELLRLENDQLKLETGGGEGNAKFFEQRIAQLRKRQSDLEKELAQHSEHSVELSSRKARLEQLQKITEELSIKLEMLDIAAESPNETERIQQIQPAVIVIE